MSLSPIGNVIIFFMCITVCLCSMYLVDCLWNPDEGFRSTGTGITEGHMCVWPVTWLLGIKPRSSGRTASSLNCRATSTDSVYYFYDTEDWTRSVILPDKFSTSEPWHWPFWFWQKGSLNYPGWPQNFDPFASALQVAGITGLLLGLTSFVYLLTWF